jgi:hypothetical protein
MIIAPHVRGHLMAISERHLGGGDFAKLSAFPGHFRWQERNAIFRATGANIQYILNNWPTAEWIGGADEVRQEYLQHLGLSEETSKEKATPSSIISDSDYKYYRKPMEHQRRAFSLSRDRKAFALFMEQGTGKTKVALDTAQYLWKQKKIEAMIVIAWPNGVHRNWVDYEIPADVGVPHLAEYWSSNWTRRYRQRSMIKFRIAPRDRLKIFCMNVEALVVKEAQNYIIDLLKTHQCLLLIDQSASIKNPQALRTKFIINKCSDLASYRRVLDGQPVAEGASELFSQFKFLDPWIIGHDTWTGFKAEYCKIGFFNEIVGYKNMDELRKKIDGHCFRVLADECQDLPPRIYKMWSFDLSKEEQRIYDELKVTSLATFSKDIDPENDELTLEEHNALVKNMRLQQISSGWWPKDKTTRIDKEKSARLRTLAELLKSIGKDKALIFARFRADLKEIEDLVGREGVSYHGGVGEEARRTAKKEFQTNKDVRYFIGQPRSAGLGHTLTEAKHVIFYSNDHSLRLREECEKRAHRQGLRHKLIIWDLVARATQDINIVRAFRAKKELANEILQDPDNFFLNYE